MIIRASACLVNAQKTTCWYHSYFFSPCILRLCRIAWQLMVMGGCACISAHQFPYTSPYLQQYELQSTKQTQTHLLTKKENKICAMSFCFHAMLSAGAGAAADAAPAFHLPVKLAFVANFICGLLHQNQLSGKTKKKTTTTAAGVGMKKTRSGRNLQLCISVEEVVCRRKYLKYHIHCGFLAMTLKTAS